jgi:hypothetical protein
MTHLTQHSSATSQPQLGIHCNQPQSGGMYDHYAKAWGNNTNNLHHIHKSSKLEEYKLNTYITIKIHCYRFSKKIYIKK